MMMAQYIPNNSEEINFIFSNNGETANIWTGYVFVFSDVSCLKSVSADNFVHITDTSWFSLYSPVYNDTTSITNVVHYSDYVFEWTLTFNTPVTTTCYYSWKKILLEEFQKFKNHYNGINNINDWIEELTNSQSKIWGLANFFIILLFEYILFFSSIIYGFIYWFRFFNGKKDS
jgi:hypothetical protein